MDVLALEQEIKDLRSELYKIGGATNKYSMGEILKVSQKLDEKIFLYQKAKISFPLFY
ncbi:aspartyl-phosphate phosphatase Spo0E family protein [Neobacillus sp. OS1-33]|uniref:aspartyl-phosphate phosphatase Spo0E family protein n=1 Tax=Neobacillus sp. OS1-33 TaxID=3070683 RepID=UPI0027DFA83F|nr:aspartyl-phosphate phosphatase Spo0E family protein [Neobacillus sp. OS1-33]WML25694.1 aspartyl-phosphate phosphatase Spo0E family protein [Neobacillus sp. OS1-33]